MQLAVIGTQEQMEELMSSCTNDTAGIVLYKNVNDILLTKNAEAIIDLAFDYSEERIKLLGQLLPKTIIVSGVTPLPDSIKNDFVRFNGWHGFLKNTIAEAAAANENLKTATEKIFAYIGKKIKWTAINSSGFVAARIVAMIINEAFLAYEEGVSTKEEIDLAMKMGTNYPYGPFEWSKKIGLKKVHDLLKHYRVMI